MNESQFPAVEAWRQAFDRSESLWQALELVRDLQAFLEADAALAIKTKQSTFADRAAARTAHTMLDHVATYLLTQLEIS